MLVARVKEVRKEYTRFPPLKDQLARGGGTASSPLRFVLSYRCGCTSCSSFEFISFFPPFPHSKVFGSKSTQNSLFSRFVMNLNIVFLSHLSLVGGIDIDNLKSSKDIDDAVTSNPLSINSGINPASLTSSSFVGET